MGPKRARISEERTRISTKGARVPISRVRKSEGFSCDVTRASRYRDCLMRLDASLDKQMNTLQVVPISSNVVFAESYMFTSKCIICKEVEKDKRRAKPSTL